MGILHQDLPRQPQVAVGHHGSGAELHRPGGEVVAVGGVAGRVYAGGSAERLDFEARVVGEAVHTGALMEVAGLLQGVAFECRLLLGNLLGDAAVARREERESPAQDGLHLPELVGVVGGKDDFHDL